MALEMTSLALQTTLDRLVCKVGVHEYHQLTRSYDSNARLYQMLRISSPKTAFFWDSIEMENKHCFESIRYDDLDSMRSRTCNDNSTNSVYNIDSSGNNDN